MATTKKNNDNKPFTLGEVEDVLQRLIDSGDVERVQDPSGGSPIYRLTLQGNAMAEALAGKVSAQS